MFDAKVYAEEASRKHIDENFDIEIGDALKRARTDLEKSSSCQRLRKDLFEKLGKINALPTPAPTTAVELAEKPWNGTTLKDALIQNFQDSTNSNGVTLSESTTWLAQCCDQRDTVFTADELDRAKELYQNLNRSSQSQNIHQVRGLRELDRLIRAMEERPIAQLPRLTNKNCMNALETYRAGGQKKFLTATLVH